jgi:hypothetical protein
MFSESANERKLKEYIAKYNTPEYTKSCVDNFDYTKKYYKITNKEEVHHKYSFEDGYNFDYVQFNPSGSCTNGGFYFTDEKHLYQFTNFGVWIREVFIPKNIPVYQPKKSMKTKWKAPVIILGKKIKMNSKEGKQLLKPKYEPMKPHLIITNKLKDGYEFIHDKDNCELCQH